MRVRTLLGYRHPPRLQEFINAVVGPAQVLLLPCVAIETPTPAEGNGMPVAFQLVGRPRSERLLLSLADHFERRVASENRGRSRSLNQREAAWSDMGD